MTGVHVTAAIDIALKHLRKLRRRHEKVAQGQGHAALLDDHGRQKHQALADEIGMSISGLESLKATMEEEELLR
jgi:hypothetical protein